MTSVHCPACGGTDLFAGINVRHYYDVVEFSTGHVVLRADTDQQDCHAGQLDLSVLCGECGEFVDLPESVNVRYE